MDAITTEELAEIIRLGQEIFGKQEEESVDSE